MYADFHRHCALSVKVIRKPAIFCIVVYTVEKKYKQRLKMKSLKPVYSYQIEGV